MFHVVDTFKRLISRRAAGEFNKIAAFLNNLCGGDYIIVERPDVPTADRPPRITLNVDALDRRYAGSTAAGSKYTGVLTAVTDVTWDGNNLNKKTRTLTFSQGSLQTVGSETTIVVDTPTKITWN